MARGTRADEADREALARARHAAEEHRLGGHVLTEQLGSRTGGLGCASTALAVPLTAVGIGLLLGPYPTTAHTIAAVLLACAVAIPVIGIRAEGRLRHRDTRLHIFDHGLVVTRHGHHALCAWPDLHIEERTEHGTYGSGGQRFTAHWLHLSAHGDPLCRLNTRSPAARHLTTEH